MSNLLLKLLKDLFFISEAIEEIPLEVPKGIIEDSWEPPMGIPKNRKEAYEVYGNPGVGSVDKKWQRENLVMARDLPGSWNGNGRNCHRKVEPFLREALSRCDDGGTLGYINRIGCFNFRHQRHDPKRPLSYHSFGAAIDINPSDNQAWYRVKAEDFDKVKRHGPIPEPFEAGWSDIWPKGVPKDLVLAFESVGWKWGGRWNSYIDSMHMELIG